MRAVLESQALAEAHTLDSGQRKCFLAFELAVERFHLGSARRESCRP